MNEEARGAAKVKAEQEEVELQQRTFENRRGESDIEQINADRLKKLRADSMNSSPLLRATEPAPQEPRDISGADTPAAAAPLRYQFAELIRDFTDTEVIQLIRIAEQIILDRAK